MTPLLATLAQLPRATRYICRRVAAWGGEVEIVPHDAFRAGDLPASWSDCPFGSAAINYRSRQVLISEEESVSVLVHELGHVFASPCGPNSRRCEEPPFLGWEMRLATEAGCFQEWLDGMADYGISFEGSMYDIGDLDQDAQLRLMEFSVRRSARLGLIGSDGRVTPHPRRRR